jgi:acyl-CoA thioesterase-1
MPFVLQDIALEPGLMQADGIHPTASAQPLILDQVWAALAPLL